MSSPKRVWTIVVAFVTLFAIQFAILIAGIAVRIAHGAKPADGAAIAQELAARFDFLLAISFASLLFIALYAVLSPERARERLGLFRPGIGWARSLVAAPLGISVAVALSYWFQHLDSWQSSSTVRLMKSLQAASSEQRLSAFLGIVVMAPLVEELFFRGIIYQRLHRRWGVRVSAIVSSLAFGLYHVQPIYIAYAFLIGMTLAWIAEIATSTWASFVAHIAINTVSFTFSVWGELDHTTTLTESTIGSLCCAGLAVLCVRAMQRSSAPSQSDPALGHGDSGR